MAAARRVAFLSALAATVLATPVSLLAQVPAADVQGREIIMITGSTGGLGREVALQLAGPGTHIIVHGRSIERGQEVVAELQARGSTARFVGADLGSLAQVRGLAAQLAREYDRLDLLINNAGIGRGQENAPREVSADGHELVFAVNYLAPYVLAHALQPLLHRGAPARIVNVSSIAQQPIDFEDVMLTRGFTASRAYAQSKLALVMLTLDLAAELPADKITANALHPATLMDTAMVEKAGMQARSTVADGADAVMRLAVSPDLAGKTGLYYNQSNEARANAQAYDPDARARLRALSRQLTGVG